MLNSEVRELIQFACDANGRPDIADMIRVRWSNRMVRSMGIASKRSSESHYTIKLSTPLFLRATEEQQRQTVIHEACHVIDSVVNKVRMSHGYSWQKCMRLCQVKPERCHSVSCVGLRPGFDYHCPTCRKNFTLTKTLHNKVLRGQRRICNVCRTQIERGKA